MVNGVLHWHVPLHGIFFFFAHCVSCAAVAVCCLERQPPPLFPPRPSFSFFLFCFLWLAKGLRSWRVLEGWRAEQLSFIASAFYQVFETQRDWRQRFSLTEWIEHWYFLTFLTTSRPHIFCIDIRKKEKKQERCSNRNLLSNKPK